VVDVNPQHTAEEVIDALAGQIFVRPARAIARRDVKTPIISKRQIATVVAIRRPLDDQHTRSGVNAIRRVTVNCIAYDLCPLALGSNRPIQPYEHMAVPFIVRVERQANGKTIDLKQQSRLTGCLVIRNGKQPPGSSPVLEMLQDE
jgi:hypothetical protein